MRAFRRLGLAAALSLSLSLPLQAAELPRGDAAALGFDPARLARLDAWLGQQVEAGTMPGAVLLIGRRGQIAHQAVVGRLDPRQPAPMPADAVFRMASMTKPIVTLAAMMLAEEGRLSLNMPLSRFVPAFREMRVGVETTNAAGQPELRIEPARRPITIQDLMRHTSGLTYGQFGTGMVKTLYQRANLFDYDGMDNAALMTRLAALPLMFQPGTAWEYGMSTDVLGRVVEVVTGKPLGEALRQMILAPLGMADTGFCAPQAAGRIAQPAPPPAGTTGSIARDPTRCPRWEGGGGGMVTTARDYARFSQMLLNGGELDGVRLVSRASIALMTANHLPPDVQYAASTVLNASGSTPLPQQGQGFGLGFSVRLDPGRNPWPGSVGDYGWSGATGTTFWVDPQQEMWVVFLMQSPAQGAAVRGMLRQFIYAALR